MDSDDGAPDDGVLDGLNLGADVDQYNVPAPSGSRLRVDVGLRAFHYIWDEG